MELREMIEAAAKIEGSQNNLAKVIGVAPDYLTHAKAGRRGLPNIACGKLAEIIGVDRWTVIAASDLVTEKNPEKRAYLTPFVLELPRKAAAWMIATASAAMIGTAAPTDANASDTLNVSTPAESPAQQGFAGADYCRLPIMRSTNIGAGQLPPTQNPPLIRQHRPSVDNQRSHHGRVCALT